MLLGAFFASFVFVICLFSHFTSASSTNEVTTASSAGVNYENADQGAWKVKKTAKIIDNDNVQLTYDVNTRLKGNGHAKDVLIMLDTSGSMTTDRVNQVESSIRRLGSSLLETSLHNRIAVKAFNTFVYDVTPGLQSESIMLSLYMGDNMPAARGGTNYYDALRSIGDFLASYQPEENRDMIVVFITDGKPVDNHPLEAAEFQVLKQQYPDVVFQGIQYEIGDEIIDELTTVSTNQFSASIATIEDVLFEAVDDGEKYSQFTLTDVLESDYYEFVSASSSKGTISTSGNTIIWNMDGMIRSGTKQTATVNLHVKQACHDRDDARCQVSRSTNVQTKLNGLADENVSFTETPILQFRYTVHYDANSPDDCTVSGTVPSDINHLISESVELSNAELSCPGYSFRGWTIATDGVMRFNDSYFKMPAIDVEIRALWSKVSIDKSMEGTIKPKTTATFKSLQSSGSNQYRNPFRSYYLSDPNLSAMDGVKSIKITDTLPADFTPATLNTFSGSDSELPIYGYFDPSDGTYYFYSDADEIYFNTYAEGFFSNFYNLTDISDLSKIHTENATSLANLFVTSNKLSDISAISGWDTANVKNMNGMLNDTRVANLDDISGWNTSSLTSLSGTFANNPSLADVSGIADWDVDQVTDMSYIFSGDTGLTSLADLADWDTGSVGSLNYSFYNMTNLNTLAGINEWDVSEVTSMNNTFDGDAKITSLAQLSGWETDNLKSLNSTFRNMTTLASVEGIGGWDVDQVTDMGFIFAGDKALTSVSSLSGWTTSSLKNLERAFLQTSALEDCTGLEDWDVSHVTSLAATWQNSGIKNTNALADWDTSNVTSVYRAFANTSSLANIDGLEDWDMGKVSSLEETFNGSGITSVAALHDWFVYPDGVTPKLTNMRFTFANTKLINLTGLDDWNVSKVTNLNNTFYNCQQLTSLTGVEDWKPTSLKSLSETFTYSAIQDTRPLEGWGPYLIELTNLDSTFSHCRSLTDITGLHTWRTDKVTTTAGMFYDDGALVSLAPLTPTVNAGADYQSWNLPVLNTMYGMFDSVSAVTSLEPLRTWTTPALKNMGRAFMNMSSVTSLEPLSDWLPENNNVTSLGAAFDGMSSVENLHGLENWDTRNVYSVGAIFAYMTNLTDVTAVADWNTGKFDGLQQMFRGDSALSDLNGLQNWNVESVTMIYEMFMGCSSMRDFSILDSWDGVINLDAMAGYNKSFAFSGVPSDARLPIWWH